jgi:hypothetical protein
MTVVFPIGRAGIVLKNACDGFLFSVDQNAARNVLMVIRLIKESAAGINTDMTGGLCHVSLHEGGSNLDAALSNSNGNQLSHLKLQTDALERAMPAIESSIQMQRKPERTRKIVCEILQNSKFHNH